LPPTASSRLLAEAASGYPDLQDSVLRRIQISLSPCVVTSKTSIVRLDYLGKGEVWDFTVEGIGNYFIGNILSHNTGKTVISTFEITCHATGRYPDWWRGVRYKRPVAIWVMGESIEWVRDKLQKKFFGPLEAPWTGWFKEDDIEKTVNKAGMPMTIDIALIKNINGGLSSLKFLSYDQSPDKFTGDSVDLIALDEEPPNEIFGQCIARTLERKGHILFTFTPERGQTPLYIRLMKDDLVSKHFIKIDEALHLDLEDVKKMYANLPEHERIARMNGIALQGDGAIFPYAPDQYQCHSFKIPDYWPRIGGLDIGLVHPTAAVALALDRDSGNVYVYQEYRVKGKSPKEHAWALKPWGTKFALSVDAFALNRQTKLSDARVFQDNGLNVFRCNNSFDASIFLIRDLIISGKFWIFKDACPSLCEEMLLYHTKEAVSKNISEVVYKFNDDLVDAMRYACMALDKAHYKGDYDNNRRSVSTPTFKPASPYGY
jgi:phage terminase large subunit-like protein